MLAFNKKHVEALGTFKLAQQLQKEGQIVKDANLLELEAASPLYSPGIFMRILLFVVGNFGVSGAVGLLFVIFQNGLDNNWRVLAFFSGFALLLVLEVVFINKQKHYKTGLNEAILYNAIGIFAGGMFGFLENQTSIYILLCAFLCAAAAIRYADSVLTAIAATLVAAFFFVLAMDGNAAFRSALPFIIMIVFAGFYLFGKIIEALEKAQYWLQQLNVLQTVSLLFVYLGGNYFVVRELGSDLNNIELQPGDDIPLAWLFYTLTVVIPLFYLFWGVKNRDRIFIWVGMLAAGFSVFTFKFYYSFGHPEVTITIAGLLLLGLAVYLLNLLKSPKKGITRERLAAANLDILTAEGVLVSQTMGTAIGGQQQETLFKGGGFGGGGASGNVD